MTQITDAILAIKLDAQVSVRGNDVEQIIWHDGNPTNITNEEILAKQAELQTEYDALAYARARETAYPELKEFAEAYTEKEIGEDSTKWNAYVTKYNLVRNNNPKP
tara:strand:- start:106 stop:423 length:318 start_codon:yes stop_codon:yes gene_type:complete